MKKALFITTVSGFLYQFELSNVKILQDMGYEVHYAANANNPGYEIDESVKAESGVIFHHVDISKSPKDFLKHQKAKNELEKLVKSLDTDLIHCHTPMGGVLGRLVGRSCGRGRPKVMYTTHGFHFYNGAPGYYRTFYMIEKKLAEYTDAIITINREDYRHAKAFRMRPGGKVYKINGEGLDTEEYTLEKKRKRRLAMRQKLGLKDDDFFVLSVGELCANKNHETVINAVASIRDRRVKYGICGMGDLSDALKLQVQKKGLGERVFLYGYCTDTEDYLYAADAFAFPSRREGLGMAAIEALASGLPCIAADNRGTREYMKPGINGFISEYNDVAGFARGILKLQNMTDEQKEKMEKNCIKSAKKFDIKNVRPAMQKIYEEMDRRI